MKTAYLIETMPEHLRDSHRAANNWGKYPGNGAEREWCDSDELYDEGEYDRVIRSLSVGDRVKLRGAGDDDDTGIIQSFDLASACAIVAWEQGVTTPCALSWLNKGEIYENA